MNIKTIGILSVSALLGVALVPAFAQEGESGFEGPGRHMRGNSAGALRGQMQAPFAGRRHAAPAGNPERFIERHDTDGDGQVSEEEFVDEHLQNIDEHFERRDRDGDGLISLEEHTPPARPARRERPERPEIDREAVIACVRETIADYTPELDGTLEERFENVDTDGDGMLSLTEVSTALEARAHILFERLDADGDAYVTATELAAHFDAQLNLRRVLRACIREVAVND
jgi:Ca2+-binding EF-hand superfamily protein